MDSMKIHKLYSNVIHPKFGTDQAACFDIHAHLRGPVTSEDVPPIIRSVKWFDSYNQLHETVPEVTFENDNPVATFKLGPQCRALIPTGMIVDIPESFSGRIHPRSGIAWKNGVTLINAEGVIDSDYREEVFVPLHNTTDIPFLIKHGDRIAQMEVTKPYSNINYFVSTEATPKKSKSNRKGGFGSTGV
tara:strand:- start:687 stop:1253 length:567 start_codon:yes stop_codon:yes gene_type:complete